MYRLLINKLIDSFPKCSIIGNNLGIKITIYIFLKFNNVVVLSIVGSPIK